MLILSSEPIVAGKYYYSHSCLPSMRILRTFRINRYACNWTYVRSTQALVHLFICRFRCPVNKKGKEKKKLRPNSYDRREGFFSFSKEGSGTFKFLRIIGRKSSLDPFPEKERKRAREERRKGCDQGQSMRSFSVVPLAPGKYLKESPTFPRFRSNLNFSFSPPLPPYVQI